MFLTEPLEVVRDCSPTDLVKKYHDACVYSALCAAPYRKKAEARVRLYGWALENMIPLSSLPFQPGDQVKLSPNFPRNVHLHVKHEDRCVVLNNVAFGSLYKTGSVASGVRVQILSEDVAKQIITFILYEHCVRAE